MNAKNLNDHVNDHYSRQALPEEAIDRLLAHGPSKKNSGLAGSLTSRWRFLSMAAMLVIAILAVPFALNHTTESTWALRAAQEVALNHKKQLGVEFSGSDYGSLRAQMSKLDFVLAAPTRLQNTGLRLVGARYCSIQGHLAAQIKLQDDQGREYTLYQTHLPSPAPTLSKDDYRINSVRIQEWQEAGIFFALARSE